eukprot:510059_1
MTNVHKLPNYHQKRGPKQIQAQCMEKKNKVIKYIINNNYNRQLKYFPNVIRMIQMRDLLGMKLGLFNLKLLQYRPTKETFYDTTSDAYNVSNLTITQSVREQIKNLLKANTNKIDADNDCEMDMKTDKEITINDELKYIVDMLSNIKGPHLPNRIGRNFTNKKLLKELNSIKIKDHTFLKTLIDGNETKKDINNGNIQQNEQIHLTVQQQDGFSDIMVSEDHLLYAPSKNKSHKKHKLGRSNRNSKQFDLINTSIIT